MTKRFISAALPLLAAMAITPAFAQNQAAPAKSLLPGGASSIQESYGEWRVICNANDKTKQCAMVQQRNDQKSNQIVIAVTLTPGSDGGATGSLLLPFGLDLAAGVSLSLDAGASGKPVAFKTCMPQGCIAPLTLGATTITSLRSGKELKFSVRGVETPADKPSILTVPLDGFGPAFDRTNALMK